MYYNDIIIPLNVHIYRWCSLQLLGWLHQHGAIWLILMGAIMRKIDATLCMITAIQCEEVNKGRRLHCVTPVTLTIGCAVSVNRRQLSRHHFQQIRRFPHYGASYIQFALWNELYLVSSRLKLEQRYLNIPNRWHTLWNHILHVFEVIINVITGEIFSDFAEIVYVQILEEGSIFLWKFNGKCQ